MRLHAVTIFLGAFLLFLVQPLIGKYILPWFGGSPGVWTTCLLFFQVLLLGGYAYAHALSTWLRPRQQAHVHLGLLLLSLAWLPIAPDPGWKPLAGQAPTGAILLLLTACLGLPYLVLSATGPLVQRWFSLTHPDRSPYRLYALSNVGSLLALVAYPFAVEPLLSRAAQSWAWSAGLVAFAVACGACAWQLRRLPATADAAATATPPDPAAPADADARPGAGTIFLWLALPALASLLLVAMSNKLSTDVAVTPFLWVMPLGLYLLSFILCFDHPRWYRRTLFSALLAAGCAAVWYLLDQGLLVRLPVQVTGYTVTLFAACMLCHGELYLLKPAARHLTLFYLCIAAGGALGGVTVALVAPLVFTGYHELPLGLWGVAYLIAVLSLLRRSRELVLGLAAGVVSVPLLLPMLMARRASDPLDWFERFFRHVNEFNGEYWKEIVAILVVLFVCLRGDRRPVGLVWRRRMSAFPLLMSVLLGVVFIIQVMDGGRTVLEGTRNFYGTLKVRELNAGSAADHYYALSHGITTHGLQFAEAPRSLQPVSYYGFSSGVGRAIDSLVRPHRHLGMVGLGAGSIAAYGLPGDRLRIYEIDPDVIRLARERFTYLDLSVAAIEIVPGDARLTLEAELQRGAPQHFDLLALDAFSSDAIPVHLLTREAVAIYLQHLKPDGILAVHISNRHLNLLPVLEALAREFQLHQAVISDDPDAEREWWLYPTTWVLLTRHEALLRADEILNATEIPAAEPARAVLWTDDHASVLSVLK